MMMEGKGDVVVAVVTVTEIVVIVVGMVLVVMIVVLAYIRCFGFCEHCCNCRWYGNNRRS